jgi:3-hydroxyacyl-[acyl-carrier-protein] dehydratase
VAILTKPECQGYIALLGSIRKARFHRSVRPGDLLMIESEITAWKDGFGTGQAEALVDGERVAGTELVFHVQPREG